MRILFTGASSFTGYWFVRELAAAGHDVVATLRTSHDAYEGVRRVRVDGLRGHARLVEGCSFGDDRFVGLIADGGWDLLCHHAAETRNYRDSAFDAVAALSSNAHNLPAVVDALVAAGCGRILLTGTIFEADEGEGDDPRAFSPYGLSKTLTYQTFRYYTEITGIHLGKFVISNPFGPLEEPRFTSYLITSWLNGEVPVVRTPDYVRDNIHVSLLARFYAAVASDLRAAAGVSVFRPGQYRESQREFALRVSAAMKPRLDRPCLLEFADQTVFSEPRVRVNSDEVGAINLGWSESDAWDQLAHFYQSAVRVRA
jgi:UDP-glucose 4-epimerase